MTDLYPTFKLLAFYIFSECKRRIGEIGFGEYLLIILHLNISTAGNFSKVLLLLQGFVHLVICHAETAKSSLYRIQCLGKYDKFGHVWHTNDFPVQLRAKVNRLLDLSAIYKPKPVNRNQIVK